MMNDAWIAEIIKNYIFFRSFNVNFNKEMKIPGLFVIIYKHTIYTYVF